MNSIIVAFPKGEVSQKIKKILVQSGYSVMTVCSTGAQVLSSASELQTGIVICGPRFVDMVYEELHEYLPKGFQMLLIAPAASVMEREIDNLICLSMPFKVHELLQTVEMMDYTVSRYKKKQRNKPKERSEKEQALVKRAKLLLMERNGFSEEEAHRYIQKRSMDNGTGLVETAQMILSLIDND